MLGGIASERVTADVDGVWDFRTEFGLLLVRSPGHHALTDRDFADKTLAAALAGEGADVAGCARWLEEQARGRAVAARRIVDLHGHSRSMAQPEPVRVDPESVLLPAGARQELLREVDLFYSGEAWYAAQGLPWRRGVMLYGPPGNGKTTAARMLASAMLDHGGAAFADPFCQQCDDGDLISAFERVSKAAPAVLILEDVDALREAHITRGCLLGLLDGTAGGARGVFTVATTNYPEEVDPALVGRAGRFDRAVHLPAPDAGTRHTYLARWWAGRPQAALLEAAVEATDGLSIASCNEVRHFVALRLRDGTLPEVRDLEEFVSGCGGRRKRGAAGRGPGVASASPRGSRPGALQPPQEDAARRRLRAASTAPLVAFKRILRWQYRERSRRRLGDGGRVPEQPAGACGTRVARPDGRSVGCVNLCRRTP